MSDMCRLEGGLMYCCDTCLLLCGDACYHVSGSNDVKD